MMFSNFGYNQKFDGVLIDTNLLLVFLVGYYDSSLIKKFKRTELYEADDFQKLAKIILACDGKLYTTPNILTEVTNLANDSINKNGSFFKFLALQIDNLLEIIDESKTIIHKNETCFMKLGLADASIANVANKTILTITDDLKLYHFLYSTAKPVLNYNNIKYIT